MTSEIIFLYTWLCNNYTEQTAQLIMLRGLNPYMYTYIHTNAVIKAQGVHTYIDFIAMVFSGGSPTVL